MGNVQPGAVCGWKGIKVGEGVWRIHCSWRMESWMKGEMPALKCDVSALSFASSAVFALLPYPLAGIFWRVTRTPIPAPLVASTADVDPPRLEYARSARVMEFRLAKKSGGPRQRTGRIRTMDNVRKSFRRTGTHNFPTKAVNTSSDSS